MLSALYQERMVTEQEVDNLKSCEYCWCRLIQTQWIKPLDVVTRTAKVLAEVGRDQEANLLKGQ